MTLQDFPIFSTKNVILKLQKKLKRNSVYNPKNGYKGLTFCQKNCQFSSVKAKRTTSWKFQDFSWFSFLVHRQHLYWLVGNFLHARYLLMFCVLLICSLGYPLNVIYSHLNGECLKCFGIWSNEEVLIRIQITTRFTTFFSLLNPSQNIRKMGFLLSIFWYEFS